MTCAHTGIIGYEGGVGPVCRDCSQHVIKDASGAWVTPPKPETIEVAEADIPNPLELVRDHAVAEHGADSPEVAAIDKMISDGLPVDGRIAFVAPTVGDGIAAALESFESNKLFLYEHPDASARAADE
jgi:hypothetical protein